MEAASWVKLSFFFFFLFLRGFHHHWGCFLHKKNKIPLNQIKEQCKELISTQVLKKSHKIREKNNVEN
jgi:hypothetical protein